ncbi:MAG: ImmA/IrrE family metallo-endopeptidase [Melioribacteraceae bacterium]|nr:ImmA/IrrE family metallo-endopeptidase [Melioribacteraceae bacterium]
MNHLIKNINDYEKALARIDSIFDAKPGTSEYDELELLTTLVELYEEKQFPIDFPDPLEAIKFRMEQLGLFQKDMTPYFGSKSKVSEILNGKRTLTLAMMRILNSELGIPAEVLLREPDGKFPTSYENVVWSNFPVIEMVNRGWLPKVDNLKEKSEELIRGFITDAGGLEMIPASYFRQGGRGRYNPKMEKYSLVAWCLQVISLSKKQKLNTKFIKGSIDLSTLKEISRLSYFENGALLAKEYLEKQGIHLIIVPHLPKTYLDGAALLLPDGTPTIALTLRYDRIDNFWFCLLHELAHVSLHLSDTERFIVDDFDLRINEIDDNTIEKEADDLASEGLIPKQI